MTKTAKWWYQENLFKQVIRIVDDYNKNEERSFQTSLGEFVDSLEKHADRNDWI